MQHGYLDIFYKQNARSETQITVSKYYRQKQNTENEKSAKSEQD